MSGSGVDVDQTDKWISRMQENDYKCLPDSFWLEMNRKYRSYLFYFSLVVQYSLLPNIAAITFQWPTNQIF